MNRTGWLTALHIACIAALLALLLFWPAAAMQGAAQGLHCCAEQILPALFPFFVVTAMILADPAARRMGLILRPLARRLGMPDPHSPCALLLGWLGGFAVAGRSVAQLYRSGLIGQEQAEFLLLCTVGSSPAFVLNAVGLALLQSPLAGLLLWVAQGAATLITAFLCRPRQLFAPIALAEQPFTEPCGLVPALYSAVQASLAVCSSVVFFSCLGQVLRHCLTPGPRADFWLSAALELTAGCRAGAALPRNALYACCAALSLLSGSVLVQVKSLVGPELSLRPLVRSRLIHLPVSLAVLALELRLFPSAAAVYSSLAPRVIRRSRAAPDAAALLFVLWCFVLHRLERVSALHSRRRRL